jgi:acyl-[acyl-carrier-protein]-phospholipid O-acyltransferase/long-chain-fatty-acid--[acyl-carrier-protein] ligase
VERASTLPARFVETAKSQWSTFCMADSTGRELTFGRALVASLLLSRVLRKEVRDASVGLLLPGSVGGAIANLAASMANKVPVNLNFTAGREAMASAIARCGITRIVTSKAFLEKVSIDRMEGMIYLEDLLRFGAVSKALLLIAARILPASVINRVFVRAADPDALATVIFSSGSTGVPKGVMLTHRNILTNIESVRTLFQLTPSDVMVGVLPFFHSFGFTGTLWFPAIVGFGVAYHPNPTDAKTIGELTARYRGSLLISTPTFCAAYVRKCRPEQFASLRYAIVGAERLREPVAAAFKAKFGVDLLEGYGCTEMAPIVAVNLPDASGICAGSVGRPLPGIDAMIIDRDTGEGPLVNTEGLLLVRGGNRMLGYLNEPDRTEEALRHGWYVTGDIATIDQRGFIRITDRLSRFSKIAGEMVPHMKIEEQLQKLLAEPHACIVTSVPDDSKGERLVAFYTDPETSPQKLWEGMCATGLPRLWIPKREDLRFTDSVPTLGTGKVDLRAVRDLAENPRSPPRGTGTDVFI